MTNENSLSNAIGDVNTSVENLETVTHETVLQFISAELKKLEALENREEQNIVAFINNVKSKLSEYINKI